ncbi:MULTISPECIES: hypothetical protein [Vibrio]|uniref:hypothetical protein n=1 Tax=Vibrio TaxID=662 RepID=UPI003D0CC4FF
MKELLSALTQATVNRLKSPILGSFILAWLVVNHKAILTFIFSDSAGKISQLSDSAPFWTTDPVWYLSPVIMQLAYPSLLAIAYTFCLPWVQHHLDCRKHKFIDEKRAQAHYGRLQTLYTCQGDVAKAQASSSLEYWREKLNRDLGDWETQRSEYEARLANMTSELEKATASLGELREEKDSVLSDFQDSKNKNNQLEAHRDLLLQEKEQFKSTLTNQQEQLLSYRTIAEELTEKDGEIEQMRLNHTALEDSLITAYNGYTELRNKAAKALKQILVGYSVIDEGAIANAMKSFNATLNENNADWRLHKIVVANIKNRREDKESHPNVKITKSHGDLGESFLNMDDKSLIETFKTHSVPQQKLRDNGVYVQETLMPDDEQKSLF